MAQMDPNCSSSSSYVPPYRPSSSYSGSTVVTPDSKNYNIEAVERVGKNLVMKVNYPNCSLCAYEGNKVLVFLGVTEFAALKWKEIDPHFRNTKPSAKQAPSPAARFPASAEGWTDAMAYAANKK